MKILECMKVKPDMVHRIAKAEYCYILKFNLGETYKKIGLRLNFSGCRARQLAIWYKRILINKGKDYPTREMQRENKNRGGIMKPKPFNIYHCIDCGWCGKRPTRMKSLKSVDGVLVETVKAWQACPKCYCSTLLLQHGVCVEQLTEKPETELETGVN